MARWYQSRWWYVERPLPWPLIALVAPLVVAAIVAAVVLL